LALVVLERVLDELVAVRLAEVDALVAVDAHQVALQDVALRAASEVDAVLVLVRLVVEDGVVAAAVDADAAAELRDLAVPDGGADRAVDLDPELGVRPVA